MVEYKKLITYTYYKIYNKCLQYYFYTNIYNVYITKLLEIGSMFVVYV